jgi:drug/metabolite transporter (DMT)-like permease
MAWLGYALLSAFFLSIASIIEKRTLFYEHAMEYSAVLATIIAIISLPFFLFIDYSNLDFNKIFLMFVTATIGAIGTFFISRSTRHMELSVGAPLLVLGPALTTILAFFVLGEKVSFVQGMGIMILILGAYFLELKPKSQIFDPIKAFIDSKFIHLMLLGLVILSIGSLVDRTILFHKGVNVYTYLAFVHFFQAIVYLIMLSIYHDGFAGIKHGFKTAGLPLFFIAALTVTWRYFQAAAIQLIFVGVALSVKRISSVFTALIGGEIFHEENLAQKVFAGIIMITGAILIAWPH